MNNSKFREINSSNSVQRKRSEEIVKIFKQLDKAIKQGIIDKNNLKECLRLSKIYPDLCYSIYAVSISESNV